MDFKVRITEQALADLEEILAYSWQSFPEITEGFGKALLDHVALLERFPKMGASVGVRPDVRKLVHTPICIYYRLDEKRRLIDVLHFWHGSRDQRILL